MSVNICGRAYLFGRHRIACPTCRCETDFLTAFGGPYYGDILTCIECGDAWSDGERLERPFRPRWRQDAIARATEHFGTALPREEYLTATWAEIEASLAPPATSKEGTT